MSERKDPNKLWAYTKTILHVTMGFLYVFIGFYVIKKQWFLSPLQETTSYALGSVLVLYGMFRMYRIYKSKED